MIVFVLKPFSPFDENEDFANTAVHISASAACLAFWPTTHFFAHFPNTIFPLSTCDWHCGKNKGEEEKLRCTLEVVEDFKTVNHGGRLEGWYCLRWRGFSLHLTPQKTAQMTSYLTKLARQWNDKQAWQLTVAKKFREPQIRSPHFFIRSSPILEQQSCNYWDFKVRMLF